MKKHLYTIVVLAVFSALFWLLPGYYSGSEALQNVSAGTRDIFFKLRRISTDPPRAIEDIVLVTIDQESCEKLDSRWPWPRRIFTRLVENLTEKGAKVIALNVSFTGLEGGEEASTLELAEAIREHGNVVVGVTFEKGRHLIKPNAIIADAVSRYGFLEKISDADFHIRRSYLLRPYQKIGSSPEQFESSFPLQVAAAYYGGPRRSGVSFRADDGLLTVGPDKRSFMIDPDGSYLINYLASESDYKRIPAWRIVEGKASGEDIQGKVVFVGLSPTLFADMHQSPYGIMSGIGIQANEFLSIVSGRFLKFVPNAFIFFLSWLVSLCVLALFLFRRFWLGFLGFAAALFGGFLGMQTAFARDLVMEPLPLLLGPLLAALLGIAANSLKLLWENKGLESKVIQDKMTGLYTYDFLRMRLEDEWKRCQKSKMPVSIVMTDLDHFKKINDTLGHETGNEMIRRAANVIRESVRGYDIVSRYGGDEFVVLLWHASLKEALAYRDRLRGSYHAMAAKLEPALQSSSISIGVACYDPRENHGDPSSPQALVEKADKDLFIDKESRRKGDGR